LDSSSTDQVNQNQTSSTNADQLKSITNQNNQREIDNDSESKYVDYDEDSDGPYYLEDVRNAARSKYLQSILKNLDDIESIQATDEELDTAFGLMTITGWLSHVDLKPTKPFVVGVPAWCLLVQGDIPRTMDCKLRIHKVLRTLKDKPNDPSYVQAYKKAMEHLRNSQKQNVEWSYHTLEEYLRDIQIDEYQNSVMMETHRIPKKQTLVDATEDSERVSKRSKNESSPPSTPELQTIPQYNITSSYTANTPKHRILSNKVIGGTEALRSSITVIQGRSESVVVDRKLKPDLVRKVLDAIWAQIRTNIEPEWSNFFTPNATLLIGQLLFSCDKIDAEQLDNYSWLTDWDWEKILANLESAIKTETQVHGSEFLYFRWIDSTHSSWIIDASDLEGTKTTFLDVLTQPLIEYGEPKTDEQRTAAINKVMEHIKRRKHQTAIYLHKRLVEELKQRPTMTWYLFVSTINKVFQDINKIIVTATLVGAMPYGDKGNKSSNTNSNSSEGTKSKYSKNTGK
jgi:hypothetical protein